MTRLVLLIILGFVAAMYFPESRAVVLDVASPVVNPFLEMSTRNEMDKIVTDLKVYERDTFGRLPEVRQFPVWIQDQYTGDGGEDAWGNPYQYQLTRLNLELRSLGPDGEYGTDDDIVMTQLRR